MTVFTIITQLKYCDLTLKLQEEIDLKFYRCKEANLLSEG